MSDSDKSFKIKITLGSDVQGAKDAEKVLDSLAKKEAAINDLRFKRAAAATHGEDTTQYDNALKKLGFTLEEHEKQTAKAEFSSRGLRRVFAGLGQDTIPQFGAALSGILYQPEIAGALALVEAIVLVKKAFEDADAALEEQAKAAADPTFLDAIKARQAALTEGAIKAQEFAERMLYLIKPEVQYANAVRDSIAANKELVAAEQERSDSKHGFDTEELKAELAEGLITQTQYYEKLTGIEVKYEQEKLARLKAQHAQEIGALQAQLDLTQGHIAGDVTYAKAVRGDATAASIKAEQDKLLLEALDKKAAYDQTKRDAEYADMLNRAGGSEAKLRLMMDEDPNADKFQKFSGLDQAYNQSQNAADKLRRQLPSEIVAAAEVERRAGRAEGVPEKETEEVAALKREIANLKIKGGFEEGTTEAQGKDTLKRMFLDQPIGGGFSGRQEQQAADFARQQVLFDEHIAGVKSLSGKQQELIETMTTFLHITGTDLDKLKQLVADINRRTTIRNDF